MSQFEPAKATADYLASLPPQAHAKALAYTQGGHWILLFAALVGLVVSLIIIRAGWLSGLRETIERKKPHPVFASFVIGIVYMLSSWVLGLPWDVYASWWREKFYGLNNQTLIDWLKEAAIGAGLSIVLGGLFIVAIYALIRRAPKTWWLWSGGLASIVIVVLIILSPVYIQPIFNKFTDVPAGPVRDAIVILAKENGVPSDKIYVYNGSKQSSRYTANVAGLFGTARVAISDAMLEKASLAEVRGVVGHEMGHYVHHHALWLAAGFSLIAVFQFWLISVLFKPVCALMGGGRIKGLSDPAGLPVLSAIITIIGLLITPLGNTLIRMVETDADVYSLEHAREPDGLSSALVKTIEYRAASPSELEETIFYDHPSVSARIRRAMDWKAAHMEKEPANTVK